MYNLMGLQECVSSVRYLVRRAGGRGDGELESLKAEYNAWLATFQPVESITRSSIPEFVEDPQIEGELLKAFIDPPTENDILPPITPEVIAQTIAQRDPRAIRARLVRLSRAWDDLLRLDLRFGLLFTLIINRVYSASIPLNRGGSTHKSIGVIWANPPEESSREDLIEFLIHEFTHNMLFLDERCHGHFASQDAYTGRESFAVSAIRRTARPLYCVFHSLIVATEVLCFRTRLLGHPSAPIVHPRSEAMLVDCIDTAESIRRIPNWERLFAPRGRQIFDTCQITLDSLAISAGLGRAGREPAVMGLHF